MITVMACFRRNTVSLLKYGILIFIILVLIGGLYQQGKEISTVVLTKFNSSRSISGFQNVVNVQRTVLQRNSHVAKSSDLSFCPLTKLSENATTASTVGQCKRMKPMKGSCQLAQKLFHSRPTANCNHQQHHSICKIEELSIGDYRVKCDTSICHGPLHLGALQSTNGSIQWTQFSNQQEMQDHILLSIHSTNTKKSYGFCYIRCKLKKEHEVKYRDDYYYFNGQWEMFWQGYATQLLVLPPQLKLTEDEILDLPFRKTKKYDAININIILIDSVSRSHFYRSMPKTVSAFHQMVNKNDNAQVFDFELYQGIQSRTFENVQAMFGGEVNIEPFGVLDLPPKPLNVQRLFGPLKQSGYRTLWLEDLCWTWEWGISKNLRVHNKTLSSLETWTSLQLALKNAFIDDLDITYSSCEILDFYKKNDPFHGLETLCFNGKHQHEYILEYLKQYQRYMTHFRLPFASYYITNIGHDDDSLRIQTLDNQLVDYISFIKNQENTVSIFVSDHGNTYGRYVEQSLEGRLEIFHPLLFIIIPLKIAKILGHDKMTALKLNQNRLISILDLHYTLQSLIPNFSRKVSEKNLKYNINSVGLFEEVSVNRSCNDLPMFPGAMCICEGHEWSVRNDSDHTLIAEFAVGQLNNELRNQFYLAHPETLRDYGTCQKLIPHRFGNVKESQYSAEGKFKVITKLDLFVRRPSDSFYEEIFYVTVESPVEAGESMTLLSYTRMTTYSIFKTCADESVSLLLCICNLLDTTKPDYTKVPKIVAPPSVFQTETVVAAVDNICLFVFSRRYPSGATFELRNICNKKIKCNFNLQTTNLETSTRMPKAFLLTAGENQFIVVAKQSVIHLPWKWKYEIQYEEN